MARIPARFLAVNWNRKPRTAARGSMALDVDVGLVPPSEHTPRPGAKRKRPAPACFYMLPAARCRGNPSFGFGLRVFRHECTSTREVRMLIVVPDDNPPRAGGDSCAGPDADDRGGPDLRLGRHGPRRPDRAPHAGGRGGEHPWADALHRRGHARMPDASG